ncbi:DUF2306 domain-containing protein [Runella sp.]|uniref:DUF2306 domain-containing protein n=1 Tax=Runella sp. TaxID=1960881 RepID=UPI003D15025C
MENRSNYFKWILFILMGLITLTVVYYKVLLYSLPSPALNRLLATKWVLVPHILFAFIALLTGPSQFSDRLRKRNLPLHRLLGKVYILAIVLAGSFALVWSFLYAPITEPANVRSMTQAVVWLLTTLIAWLAAVNRQIGVHQVWMARSYGVTFTFVLSRFLSRLPAVRQMSDEHYIHFLWILLVFSLIIPELFLNGKLLLTKQPKRKFS